MYGAVPPPPQLQTGVNSPVNGIKVNDIPTFIPPNNANLSSVASSGPVSQSFGLQNPGLSQANTACYPHGLTSATSYIGYGGLYPQTTPLQQVALALRQSTSPVTATVSPVTTAARTDLPRVVPPLPKDKHSQKRKFQELPVAANGPAHPNQVSYSLLIEEIGIYQFKTINC